VDLPRSGVLGDMGHTHQGCRKESLLDLRVLPHYRITMKSSKSKLTSKYQTTIPQEVREFLLLQKGDEVIFEIENGQVVIRKATALDLDYLASVESTLSEWNSENDEEAYKTL
jgi:AbrB family looped-hinge helix DNA binding protein